MLIHFSPFVARFGEFGLAGVRLFFVLSGFLITALLLRAKSRIENGSNDTFGELRSFYVRRALRLWPVYGATLVLLLIFNVDVARQSVFWHLAFATNFYVAIHDLWPGSLSHFWSLAVEHQFYFFWPFAVLLPPRRFLPKIIASVILTGALTRGLLPELTPLSILGAHVLPLGCLDFFGCGAAVATVFDRAAPQVYGRTQASSLLLGFGALWLVIAGLFIPPYEASFAARTFGPLLEAAFFALLIRGILVGEFPVFSRAMRHPWLVSLGVISYSVYALHYVTPWISQGILRRFGFSSWNQPWSQTAWLFLLSLVAGATSWWVLERPVLKWRWRRVAAIGS
jgi:peptidoglycan/LPS O-acetylase OafA/YrhL